MNTTLLILALVCLVIGLIGSLVPALPGPPLSWVGLLLFAFTEQAWHNIWWVVGVMCAVMLFLIILDYLLPAWEAKRYGGSKAGQRGATIGVLVSLVVFPIMGVVIGPANIIGILLGPLVGAYLGEVLSGDRNTDPFKAAWGSFVGLLASTLVKFLFTVGLLVYVIVDIIV